ncbi:MAG: magnesium transporter CorA family protein, partial [Dehalococcoidia bacterium]|nr:magnesium transporter CorA family protein [Dehalococcoidia bacterium]
ETENRRPRAERHDSALVFTLASVVWQRGRGLVTHDVRVVFRPDLVVTVHWEPVPEIEEVSSRWRAREYRPEPGIVPAMAILYGLLDTVLDRAFQALDSVSDELEKLESAVFAGRRQRIVERVFRLRRGLLELRRSIAPLREVSNALLGLETKQLGDQAAAYAHDVYDRVLRILEQVDTAHDLLAGVLEAHLSVASNELNQTMRTLTAWSIILMSLSLIAGLYGMNFHWMPGLDWRWGFLTTLLIMGMLGVALYFLFRRIQWL